MELADILRWIAIAEVAFSVGFVLRGFYMQQSKYLKYLALSYVIYGIAAIDLLHVRMGTELSWRTPLILAGATIAVVIQLYKDYCDRHR